MNMIWGKLKNHLLILEPVDYKAFTSEGLDYGRLSKISNTSCLPKRP